MQLPTISKAVHVHRLQLKFLKLRRGEMLIMLIRKYQERGMGYEMGGSTEK